MMIISAMRCGVFGCGQSGSLLEWSIKHNGENCLGLIIDNDVQ